MSSALEASATGRRSYKRAEWLFPCTRRVWPAYHESLTASRSSMITASLDLGSPIEIEADSSHDTPDFVTKQRKAQS
jgi:hypothetical protein